MPDPAVTMRRVHIADQRWQAAIDDSAFAPPDHAFADRVRAIAMAAEGEAVALHEAARTPKLKWNPGQNSTVGLTYELRPGGNRPGPPDSWDQFDTAIEAIIQAQRGSDLTAIADAFREFGITAMRLAGEIDAERANQTPGRASA